MRRNSTQLELITPGATTWLPWISDPGFNRVDGYPNFDAFSGQSRTIREATWQDFLDSGEELEVIPDPEPPPPEPDWTTFNATMLQKPSWQSWTALLPLQLVMGIVSASTLRHIEEVQSGLAIAYQISDPGPAFKAEWQSIANANHVPVVF